MTYFSTNNNIILSDTLSDTYIPLTTSSPVFITKKQTYIPNKPTYIPTPISIPKRQTYIPTSTSYPFQLKTSPINTPIIPMQLPSYLIQDNSNLIGLATLDPRLNLNLDTRVHKKVAKFFYYKTLDKWLRSDFISILNYLKYENGKVDLISKLENYSPTNNDSEDVISKKIDFIENNILDEDNIRRILKEFVKETNINWYDLTQHTYTIKSVIKSYLKEKLVKMIRKNA